MFDYCYFFHNLHRSLNHENVLGIIGKATEKEPYIVVLERSPMVSTQPLF